MQLVIVIALFAAVFIYDGIFIFKNMCLRSKFVYFSLMTVSFGLLLLFSVKLLLPSPTHFLVDAIKAVLNHE